MYAQGVDVPLQSAKVEFVDLAQTEEYKNYTFLQLVNIGDTIRCKYRSTELSLRVVSYDYDSLTKKYTSIVLGKAVATIEESLWAQDLDLSALKAGAATTLKEGEAYNACSINHTDGFVAKAAIGGQEVTAKFNAEKLGWYDSGDNLIGGMALVNSVLAMIAGILTNASDGDCYATIGNLVEDEYTYRGISIFLKSLSTTTPALRIYVSSTSGGRVVIKTYGGVSLKMDNNFPISVTDAAGVNRIHVTANNLQLYDAAGELRLDMTASDTYLLSPDGEGGLGVDNTGPYYVKGYEVNYF